MRLRVIDSLRSRTYGVLSSELGNGLAPVRWAKSAALYCNDVVGRPLADLGELDERVEAERQIREAKAAKAAAVASEAAAQQKKQSEAAPVVLFHNERHPREVNKIKLMLEGSGIPYQARDLSGDEASIEAVDRDSGGRELPLVFIAGDLVGGAQELGTLELNGKLQTMVFGS